MQSAVTDEIVEKLKGITLLEASELVKVRPPRGRLRRKTLTHRSFIYIMCKSLGEFWCRIYQSCVLQYYWTFQDTDPTLRALWLIES